MYSLQINLLLLKPLLLASDPESTVFPCARPPLDQVRSLFLLLFSNFILFFLCCMDLLNQAFNCIIQKIFTCDIINQASLGIGARFTTMHWPAVDWVMKQLRLPLTANQNSVPRELV